MAERRDYRRIKGPVREPYMPRLGKIRVGVKAVSPSSGKEYPKEVDYFVVPLEVERVYGPKPKALDIVFPIEDETRVFPQALKAYVQSGLRCKGDKETALRRRADLVWTDRQTGALLDDARGRIIGNSKPDGDQEDLVEVRCPCPLLESGDCSQKGNLMVVLWKVSCGGVYQLDTGSVINFGRVNDYFEWLRATVRRIAWVPIVMSRVEEMVEFEGKKRKHWPLKFDLNADIEQVAKLRADSQMILTSTARLAIPAPVEDGQEPTGEAVVAEEEDSPIAQEPSQPAPPTTQAQQPQEETPVAYWKRNILTAKSLSDLKALWDNFAKKGGRYHDFTEKEQKELAAAKETRKAALGGK